METSILIARMLGPFYVLVGISMLLNRSFFEKAATGIEESPALFYISGVLAFAFGATIVAIHSVWSGWPLLITLLGWAGVVKGSVRIALPDQSRAMVAGLIRSPNALTGTALVALALGVYLTAQGFWLAA
jgi:hypothetical protein